MSSPLEVFAELLTGKEERIDLIEAGLMVAEDVYRNLDRGRYLRDVEFLAERLRAALPSGGSAESRVAQLNRFVFHELGFAGNADHYYDPRNSYLNEVLDRRTGIPITLAIVYMGLGRKIGLPLEGVSFPGHFLVRLRLRRGMLVLDPFAGGEPLSADELRERLARVVPRAALGGVALEDLPLEKFLEPASRRQILARLLRNLKGIYTETQSHERLIEVANRLVLVAPEAWGEYRDRGAAYAALECWRPALQDLETYLAHEPDAADADMVRVKAIDLRIRCARLN